MGPAISGSMGAPPGHGIGNGLQMAGKDFICQTKVLVTPKTNEN